MLLDTSCLAILHVKSSVIGRVALPGGGGGEVLAYAIKNIALNL